MKTEQLSKYVELIQSYCKSNYKKCFREKGGKFNHPYFVPGASYAYELWDWDSWLTDYALDCIADEDISSYEKGCVLDFLENADEEGRIPINIKMDKESIFDLKPGSSVNIHKPCLAQHALFISRKSNDGAEWLRERFPQLRRFIAWYDENAYHAESGLYVWINDFAIGVDNDPCVFYRPDKSTASIFLNNLMYCELCAMSQLCAMLSNRDGETYYAEKAERLKASIQAECWDERDGFFYSADVALKPVDPNEWLHSGAPRKYRSLPMRIGVWTGFLCMWNGIATKEQAKRMVEEHYLNEKTFNAPYGVRSLSKAEKMYAIENTGNPSCWIGPIWVNANYMVAQALRNYGYDALADELEQKTVECLGKDLEECGEFHEYYHPETGEGIRNKGFQSWNLLVYNMAERLKNKN